MSKTLLSIGASNSTFAPCVGQWCGLKSCEENRTIRGDDEAVMIVTNEKILQKVKGHQNLFMINWKKKGSFGLHKKCWDHFSRNRKLHRQERSLKRAALETIEYYEAPAKVEKKARETAQLLANSNRAVVFTGAGVSTSSGIPDYRGTSGIDTVSEMAADANKLQQTENKDQEEEEEEEEEEEVDYTLLQPTKAHYAITKLHKLGLIKYVITQNCDDLHAKSGLPRTAISDLHGNVFVEYCEKCRKEYIRTYAVDAYSTDCYKETWWEECPTCRFNHYTGRKCSKKKCKGKLRDTIVNFGDELHGGICGGIDRATEESQKADVMIGLGSSLTVHPANSLVNDVRNLVICNLQQTDFDAKAAIRVHGSCDVFMEAVLMEARKLLKGQQNLNYMGTDQKQKVSKKRTRNVDSNLCCDDGNEKVSKDNSPDEEFSRSLANRIRDRMQSGKSNSHCSKAQQV